MCCFLLFPDFELFLKIHRCIFFFLVYRRQVRETKTKCRDWAEQSVTQKPNSGRATKARRGLGHKRKISNSASYLMCNEISSSLSSHRATAGALSSDKNTFCHGSVSALDNFCSIWHHPDRCRLKSQHLPIILSPYVHLKIFFQILGLQIPLRVCTART